MTQAKLKLLFYVKHLHAARGGLESNAVRLCQNLGRRGHEVHVLVNTGDDIDDVTVHFDGIANRARLEGRLLPHICIDWAFCHPADIHRMGEGTHQGFIGYNLDAYHGLRRMFKKLKYRSPKHQGRIAREKAILRNPQAHFLANSQLTANLAIADGANPERVTVKHNGVNLQRFRAEPNPAQRQDIRTSWGVRDDEVAFIFVAHNLKLKNLDLLRRVFKKAGGVPNAKLVVAGKRKPRFRAPWLVYAGRTQEIESFYAGADVLLHPTYFDSCANVVLEAMACSLPVVVSDTCGVDEIVRHDKDGQVLSVRSEDSRVETVWRDAIRELTKNSDLRTKQARAARGTAEQHSDKDYMDWFESYLNKVFEIKKRELNLS